MVQKYKTQQLLKNELKLILMIILNNVLVGKNQIIFKKFLKISHFFLMQKLLIFKGNAFRFLTINKFLIKLIVGKIVFTRKPFKYVTKIKILNSKKR